MRSYPVFSFLTAAIVLATVLISPYPSVAVVVSNDNDDIADNSIKNVKPITNAIDLPVDDNGRIINNYLLYSDNDICIGLFSSINLDYREILGLTSEASEKFFGGIEADKCAVVCIQKGTHIDSVFDPLPQLVELSYVPSRFNSFVTEHCQKVEVGFLSYAEHVSDIMWLDQQGNRQLVGILKQGERNTVWQGSFLGHEFFVVDQVTKQDLLHLVVTHDSINPIGSPKSAIIARDIVDQVRDTFDFEWERAHIVTRTFTDFGFNKGRLPPDLWASISGYYYNNRNNKVLEEWGGKGLYVNWWETDVYFIPMPWDLKRYWQSRLKDLVEQWSGVELELTDIYGMRRYEDGARLLAHVDREETHATSLIINVAQGEIRTPWKVEIFDFEDRLHEVEMDEGDIVYYESARCLHGRMRPLDGAFYVNLFAHYRPVGDRAWFTKSNPDGTPIPVGDLGNCSVIGIAANDDEYAATDDDVGVGVDGSSDVDSGRIGVGSGDLKQVVCSKADSWGVTTPHLSPSLLQLSGGKDLFKMWYDITVSISSIHDGDGSDGGNSSSADTRSVRDEL